jgi:phospholipid transport system transporter-binding protein
VAAGFPASITLEEAPAALAAARALLAAGGGPIDLAPLERFDSSAVAVLLALRREGGPTVSFGNVPPNLRKLASLYGVEAALFGGPT